MVEQDLILRLDAVTLARGGRVLVERLSLALRAGEAALVTGPNGAGKSSLLRLAAGLLRADAGRVAVAGRCALLAEAAALNGEATLAAALAFWARMDGIGAVDARVAAALAALDLAPLGGLPVRLLSTGQRRRAGLARVAASGAALWLLDEPGNGLDGGSVARLEALIAQHRAGGGAVVVATHQPLALPGAVTVRLDRELVVADPLQSVRAELVEARPAARDVGDALRQAQGERAEGSHTREEGQHS